MQTITLLFDEWPDDEVVLRTSPVPLRAYFDIVKRFSELGESTTPDEVAAFLGDFAALTLVSWTFPEPATAEGFLERDYPFTRACVRDWLTAMREVEPPLPRGSSEPTTSTASEDPTSSPAPKRSTRGSARTRGTR